MKSWSAILRLRAGAPLAIAGDTLRQAYRQLLPGACLVLALGFMVGAHALHSLNFGAAELKFLGDWGFGAIAFFGAALTITTTAQLLLGGEERAAAQMVLAKPVWRVEFIAGRYLGVAVMAGVFCAVLTTLLALQLYWRQGLLLRQFPQIFADGGEVHFGTLLVSGFLQWLQLTVLAAFVLLVASFAESQLFAMGMGFVIWVGGQLRSLAPDPGPVAGLLPDFQLFAPLNPLTADGLPPWVYLGQIGLYALGHIVTAVGLAVFVYRRRDL